MLNVICRMFFSPSLVHGCALLDKFTGGRDGEEKSFDLIYALLHQRGCLYYHVGLPDPQPAGEDKFKNALVLKLLFQCQLVSL